MKLRPFELALIAGFGIMGMLALALLSGYKPNSKTENPVDFKGAVAIWGTLDTNAINDTLKPLIEKDKAYGSIIYTQKDEATFDSEILNALAENRGPDLIILPSDKLTSYRAKIQPISYSSFPLRDFKNLYIDGAEIFSMSDGVYAYPVAVDPLVMYWNRSIFGLKNFLAAPTTWEQVVGEVVPQLVERDGSQRTIIRSPLAFGVYQNEIRGADTISMLALQGGSAGVTEERENRYSLLINQTSVPGVYPLDRALAFYTGFANPANALYSWNRSFTSDRDAFLAEQLALYFGRGSEARMLAQKNPNLNFDIAEVPQGQTATIRRTHGTYYGLALLKSAKNVEGAGLALQTIGAASFATPYANALGMAPATRAALTAGSNDTYGRIIYTSAIMSRAWWQPAPAKVDTVFTGVVEDILANRRQPSEAAGDAVGRLSQSY